MGGRERRVGCRLGEEEEGQGRGGRGHPSNSGRHLALGLGAVCARGGKRVAMRVGIASTRQEEQRRRRKSKQ